MSGGVKYGDVFISFAEEDLDQATLLRNALERVGLRTWMFTKNAKYGDDAWVDSDAALRDSLYVVFIVSEYFIRSPHCNDEVKSARGFEKESLARLKRFTAIVIDESKYGDEPFWLFFSSKVRAEYGHRLNADEAMDFAAKLEAQIHESLVVEGPPAEAPSAAVLASWTPDRTAATVRVAKEHPQAKEVRACLIDLLGIQGGDGVWPIMSTRYLSHVVPALEAICGKGCCPSPPSGLRGN